MFRPGIRVVGAATAILALAGACSTTATGGVAVTSSTGTASATTKPVETTTTIEVTTSSTEPETTVSVPEAPALPAAPQSLRPDGSADCRRAFSTDPAACGDGVDLAGYDLVVADGVISVTLLGTPTDPEILGAAGRTLVAELVVANQVGEFVCGFGNATPESGAGGTLGVYVVDSLGTQGLDKSSCSGTATEVVGGWLWELMFDPAGLSGLAPVTGTRVRASLVTYDAAFRNDSADDAFDGLRDEEGWAALTCAAGCSLG